MSFRLFLLCSFVLIGRPQDILPFLQPLRPALVLTVLAVAAMMFGARRLELSATLSMPEAKRYLLFYLIMIIGIPFAYHRRSAFEGVFEGYLVNMLFFFLLVSQVTTLQRLKSLLWVVCLCTLIYSVFGGLLQAEQFSGGRFHLAGQMFDPNDTAYLLVSLFPLCLYFVRFDKGLLKGLVALVAIIASIAMILNTGSRGGILGIGAVLLVLLLTRTGNIGASYKWATAIVLVSALLYFHDAIDFQRYLTLADISSDYNVSSQEGRLQLWEAAIGFSFANPLTGVGVNCFPWAHFLAREARGEHYLQYHTVHNSYLQVAAEIGLVGFTVFVVMNVKSLLSFFRMSRMGLQIQSHDTREIGALGGFMLLGFMGLQVSGLFLSQGYSIISTLYFALAATLARLQVAPAAAAVATRGAASSSSLPGLRNPGRARQNGARQTK